MLRSKLPETNKALTDLKKQFAQMENCVDLAAAIPGIDMPETLKKGIAKYIQGAKNQYAPVEGIPNLRKAVSDYYDQTFGHKYNPETEVTITAGATEALWAAITAIIHEDDEVIILEPSYENYVPAVRINGGTPIFVTLKHPSYRVDWNEVIRMVNQRTKMIIINSPHTPSGMTYTEEDFKNLQKIVVGNKITVLSDETFGALSYSTPFISIAKFPALAKQSIVISSLGKAFNASGWKTGTCAAPADITKEIRRMHNYICNGSNAPVQYAMADLMNGDIFDKARDLYKKKRDLVCQLLKGSKYKVIPAEGTWFQLVDYSDITKDSDKDFCLRLAKDFGVLTYPMSPYYHDKQKTTVIRICFARPDELLKKGIERMLKASSNY